MTGFILLRGVGWDSLGRHQVLLTDWVGLHPIGSAALFIAHLYRGRGLVAAAGVAADGCRWIAVRRGPRLRFDCHRRNHRCIDPGDGGSVGICRRPWSGSAIAFRRRSRIRLAQDGFSYLLALRLLPLFPFWVVNLAAAVAGIRLIVFMPATFLGIIPASFVFSSIGAGVGAVLAEGHKPDLSVLFSAHVLLPLAGLAVLSLLPVLWRHRPRVHA